MPDETTLPKGWVRLTRIEGDGARPVYVHAPAVLVIAAEGGGSRLTLAGDAYNTLVTESPAEVLRRIAEAEGGASTEGVEWTSGEEDDWNAEVAGAQCTVWPTGDGCGSWAWQTVGGRWRDAEGNCPDADGAKRAVIAVARALAMSDRGGSDA